MSNPRSEILVSVRDKASAALRNIGKRLGVLNNPRLGAAMQNLRDKTSAASGTLAMYSAGAVAAGAASAMFVKGVLETGSQFERYRTTLEAIEGSQEKAAKAMSWVQDFARQTPYELSEVNEAFVKMRGYGLDAQKGLLKNIGDTAGILGKDLMQGVEAIGDALNGENERLNEFANMKASKVGQFYEYTYTNLKTGLQETKRAAAGNRKEIEDTISSIMALNYGGGMDKLSGTWEGMLSNLADAWEGFKLKVANAGVFDYLKGKLSGLLDTINNMANSGELDALAETVGKNLVQGFERAWEVGNKFYNAFVKINDYLGGFENTLTVLAGILALPLVASLVSVTTALWGVGAALMATPVGWVIAAIAGLIAIGLALYYNWDEFAQEWAYIWEGIKVVGGGAFEFLKTLFLNFTPLGWIMQAMEPMLPYLDQAWEAIKSFFSGGIGQVMGILFSFTPIGAFINAFEPVKAYVLGVINTIIGWISNLINKVQTMVNNIKTAASDIGIGGGVMAMTNPIGAAIQSMKVVGKHFIDMKISSDKTTKVQSATSSKGVTLSQKQGVHNAR